MDYGLVVAGESTYLHFLLQLYRPDGDPVGRVRERVFDGERACKQDQLSVVLVEDDVERFRNEDLAVSFLQRSKRLHGSSLNGRWQKIN